MNPFHILAALISAALFLWSLFYLSRRLRRDRQIMALIGLSCMAMGVFLLVLDLALIAFTHGPQLIPDYLRFNRLVADPGFAGRWMLTVYVFICTGFFIAIYLLARTMITRFNKPANAEKR